MSPCQPLIQLIELPSEARANRPVSDSDLQHFEVSLGKRLPAAYRKLLTFADGFSVSGGLLVYGTQILSERNSTWEVDEYAPEFIAIGDTGGGDVLLLSLTADKSPVYMVGSGTMSPEYMVEVSPGLWDWINSGCPINVDRSRQD